MNHEPWTESASCASVGGDVWYPEVGDPTWMDARRICSECPVIAVGIAAEMSPHQRHKYEPEWLTEQQGEIAA